MYLFTVKYLHLLQLTSYVHKLQYRVHKSRKDLKPARIFYYGNQTDANLVFFLTYFSFSNCSSVLLYFFLHFNTYCIRTSIS